MSVWVLTWVILCANNARRVASKIFAFNNAFLLTFDGGATADLHGGLSFSASFDGCCFFGPLIGLHVSVYMKMFVCVCVRVYSYKENS